MEISLRTFIKNSGILAISAASAKLINFLLLPLYTSMLSPFAYGITDTIMATVTLSVGLFSLCMDWGIIASFYDEPSLDYQRKITSSSLAYFLVSIIACVSLSAFSGAISKMLFHDESYYYLVMIGIAIAMVELFYFPLRVSTRMRGNAKMIGLFSFIQALVNVGCSVLFVLVLKLGNMSVILSLLFSYTVAAVLYFWENRTFISYRLVDRKLIRKLLMLSAPVTPIVLSQWVNNVSDRYVIGYFFTQKEVGFYGISARMVGFLSIITAQIVAAYTSFAVANAKDESSRAKYSTIFDLLVFFLAVVSFGITIFSKEIILVMTSPEYHNSYFSVGLLIYAHSFYIMQAIVGYAIIITKKMKLYMIIGVSSAVLNLSLNFWLIPRYGYVAAALTTFISQLISSAITFFISEKIFPCAYRASKALLVLLAPLPFIYIFLLERGIPVKILCCLLFGAYLMFIYLSLVKDFLKILNQRFRGGLANKH